MSEITPEKLLSNDSKARFIENARWIFSGEDDGAPKLRASVLIPICVVNDEVCVIFTLRSSKLKRDGGVMSLPGGKIDPGETSIETALRETNEELGIAISDIEVWTEFPKIISMDNDMCLVPVVGFIPNFNMSKLNPNPDEVEKVYVVPVRSLVDKTHHGSIKFRNVILYLFNCPEAEYHNIWGVTAFVVALFLLCLVPNDIYDADLTHAKEYDYDKINNKSKL